MAGIEETPAASASGAPVTMEVVPSEAAGDAAAPSTENGKPSGRDFQKSGQNRKKRKGGAREKGRGDWQRSAVDKRAKIQEYHERKRTKINKDGEEYMVEKTNPFSQEEIAAEQRRPKRKVAVMVGYSGTGYRGMQVNNDEPTIERDLFRAFVSTGAISKANADDPKKSSLARCARTDKGVHAAGNVISLKLIIEDEDIADKINEALPAQIRVWGIERTSNSFSCYQSCDSRWYEYLMPSYSLLPPHPQTFLGKRVAELAKEHGYEEELAARMADVKDFWTNVDQDDVKPVLDSFDPELRAQVLERIHTIEDPDAPKEKTESKSTEKQLPSEQPQTADDADAAATDSTAPQSGGAIPGSTAPKKRDFEPLDFALRDIKHAYISAKRRYRVSPERLQRLQAALDEYKGTRNFHNYTVQKSFKDPSAMRHIKSFEVNPKPIIIGDTEWLSLKVHGQSFMMHQIRKMVGLASLMVRCGTPIERVRQSYRQQKIAIPKAPGLGLLLERPVFEAYNNKATEVLGRGTIDFSKYDAKLEAFKQEYIYNGIFEVEEREATFHTFFNQIDQFKQNDFLWLTAGGLDVAKISGKEQVDVDKKLGDEDEDPEGGDG